MKNEPHNRLLGYNADQESSGKKDEAPQADRGIVVRTKLMVCGELIQQSKLNAAYLLEECRSEGYWAEHYSSFKQYVEEEVCIPWRTAQELMRVAAKCREANVPPELVVELGWSKVALVASRMTAENAAELLGHVEHKTYGQLQEMVRQLKRKDGKSGPTKRKASPKKDEQPAIILSAKMQEAMRLACIHTRDQTAEVNLDFVAAKFMELCPPPSLLPSDPSLN